MRDLVRRFNKYILNPAMGLVAGRRHWYAARLHHRGRRSGRAYATPVVAVPVADDFLVPLPYGESVDWLRNVQAAGTATLDHQGVTYAVSDPLVLDAAAALPLVPADIARTWRLFRIEHFVRFTAHAADRVADRIA